MRRNETLSSFDGMTGRRWQRPSLFRKGVSNVGKGGQNDPGHPVIPIFRSCRLDCVPRSDLLQNHSAKSGTFRMTSEGGQNEERGGKKVG